MDHRRSLGFAPGHNGFFTSPDGTESWIVYHANDSAGGGCDMNRSTRAQRFTWNADGTPNFGIPARLGTALTVPSGE
ncbi:family 43 glycosylhydrolase [Micromonospora sp. NPDC049523]|uniref:family 43 glycosylhydrolase n=1 Tax=Micromonospora sp. NPDC049523 TaxID=3155921 RepID=UPI003415E0CC